jgi:hypothetical protein
MRKIKTLQYLEELKTRFPDIGKDGRHRHADSCIAYAEFFGPHTFAGKHDPEFLGVESNDPKELVLFDVNIHNDLGKFVGRISK